MERLRTRTTTSCFSWSYNGAPFTRNFSETITESFWESNFPGPCACVHHKYPVKSFQLSTRSSSEVYSWSNYPLMPSAYAFGREFAGVNDAMNTLNWKKIPSSSDFSLINILWEIEETIALFTMKFWRELNYGSFTWGVMPFIQDLQALVKAIGKLRDYSFEDFPYTDTETVPVNDVHPLKGDIYSDLFYIEAHGKVRVRKTGRGSVSKADIPGAILDFLGVHPDLATAWDLVPLSFVVDYFFHVSDYLENMRNGGWIKTIDFSGWLTLSTKTDLLIYKQAHPSVWATQFIPAGFYERFIRLSVPQRRLTVGKPPAPKMPEIPDLTKLFNTFYVAAGFASRGLRPR